MIYRSLIHNVCMTGGLALGFVSAFNWIYSYKEDNTERRSKAIKGLSIAGVLICIKLASVIASKLINTAKE